MYDNFYYAELLVLIPLVPSAFFLYLTSSKRLDSDLRFLSVIISGLFGVLSVSYTHLTLPTKA